MKKYFAIVLAAVTAIACQKEVNEPQVKGVFTASVESYDETKTFTDATLQVKWSKGDYLNIWEHNAVADQYTITDASVGKNTASLSMVQKHSSGFAEKLSANVGFYPYNESITCVADGDGYKLSGITLPATQTYAAGSFGNGALPMVAVTSGESDYALAFRNVCGVLRISLTGDMFVKTISITGNNGEVLSGSAELTINNKTLPSISMTGTEGTVTLDCGDGVLLKNDAPSFFDIVLPPIVFEKGFTVKVNSREYLKTTNCQTIKRSRILCMNSKAVGSAVVYSYLKFTSTGETKISLTKEGAPNEILLRYLIDSDDGWKDYTIGQCIVLSNGESVYFKANENDNSEFSSSGSNYYIFTMSGSGSIKASGNIMSLLDADCKLTKCPGYCFQHLFKDCVNLIAAPDLPAKTLGTECYAYMFSGCAGLQAAPNLPARTMAIGCYSYMFQDCTGLIASPELPATNLDDECYRAMFSGCTGLTIAPELPAETLDWHCYRSMFLGCSNLTIAPKLPAGTMQYCCYESMFQDCTSLTIAPELPSTNLDSSCYESMFQGCTSLKTAPSLPATNLSGDCYMNMFAYCGSLTTAPQLPATVLMDNCYEGMFIDCTSLTAAPELPATKARSYCYSAMFQGCTGLITAPNLPATILGNGCYNGMFRGCTSLTSAPDLLATSLSQDCYHNMFRGCSNIRYIKMLADYGFDRWLCLDDWVVGVSATGTFVKGKTDWEVRGDSGIPNGWEVKTE